MVTSGATQKVSIDNLAKGTQEFEIRQHCESVGPVLVSTAHGHMHTHTLNAHTLNAHTPDAHTLNAHTLNAHTPDAHTLNAHTPDAHTLNAHTPDAHTLAQPLTHPPTHLHWQQCLLCTPEAIFLG